MLSLLYFLFLVQFLYNIDIDVHTHMFYLYFYSMYFLQCFTVVNTTEQCLYFGFLVYK